MRRLLLAALELAEEDQARAIHEDSRGVKTPAAETASISQPQYTKQAYEVTTDGEGSR